MQMTNVCPLAQTKLLQYASEPFPTLALVVFPCSLMCEKMPVRGAHNKDETEILVWCTIEKTA
jgi:hypothetical protein